ncbi:MAG: laccase domain-containing protein, partial [Pseudomonadota bacterium]
MFITIDEYNPANIRYRFFTKKVNTGHRYFHHHEGYAENKAKIAQHFGSEDISIVDQKHTNNIVFPKKYGEYLVADGQITNKPNIALAVITADCVPILLSDEKKNIIASVHAGWRGARSNIINEALEKMRSLGANNITALIGPCIRQRSYEVDNSFYKDFIEESITYKKFFIPSAREKYYMFDLPGY